MTDERDMDEEHERRADELEHDADRMDERSDEIGADIKDLREDWDQKQSSEQVPGATEPAAAAPGGLGEEEEDDDSDAEEDSDDEDGDTD